MTFIILGYGVPKNIIKDQNYNFYLRTVFNKIFDLANSKPADIIFCGGRTNLVKPYQKSESAEMIRLFKTLCQRPFLKNYIKSWKLIGESKSISTLENLIYAKKLIRGKESYIFCEVTRSSRISKITSRIFKGCKLRVLPIDFDQSKNRYELKEIKRKESVALKLDLKALQNDKNLKLHHNIYVLKIKLSREAKVAKKDLDEVNRRLEKEIKKFQH